MLLIDNYDSFTHNLAHLFGELGAEVEVRRNDVIDADEAAARALTPRHFTRPRSHAGATKEIIRRLAPRPDARVCLGHQAIVEVFGARSAAPSRSCTARPA